MHYDFWARSAGKRNRAVRCNLFPALKAGKGFPLPSLARNPAPHIHLVRARNKAVLFEFRNYPAIRC
jgi:hypothetical protein